MKSKSVLLSLVILAAFLVAPACAPKEEAGGKFEIAYESYKLDNGLEVILHEDRSDPITAVALQFHVGSNREEVGRTGFAHLFEHMMFQESQHVGQDQFFQMIQAAGGTLNGGTSRDGTIYFEVVPKNALELALWLEADRLGYLRSTITKEAFVNQQNVVKNEKRQGENRPYGHNSTVLNKLLYPDGHPYNWTVIGSMEDLTSATLKDVHGFHQKWYRTNNTTLVVAGDFDKAQTMAWIEKYFGEIEAGPDMGDPTPQPVTLTETKMAFHEDNFAKSPELTMVIPTVEQYHPDAYPLSFLGQLLSNGKKAPMYKIIVEEKKLAPRARANNRSNEIAGEFQIRIRTFPNVNLNDVMAAIDESFERFETDSITEQDVERIKAGLETDFYSRLNSILMKGFQLARYNEYAGSPGFISTDLANIQAVTKEDILRVYEKYIKDKNYVLTSFVPKGQADLVVAGSERFPIEEEQILAREEAAAGPAEEFKVEKAPTSFDRSAVPPFGPDPAIVLPQVWQDTFSNGIKVYGIEQRELPLVQFSLTIKGGQLFDDFEKLGVANIMTDILMEGTKNKTPLELEEAIDDLGASINMYTGRESIFINANCLASKFTDVYSLVEEILLEPRWDEKEFSRIKRETIESINQAKANPRVIASNTFYKLIYGNNHTFGYPTSGTNESVEAITIDDLKTYYQDYFSPSLSHLAIAGDISQAQAVEAFKSLEENWAAKDVALPEYQLPKPQDKAAVYFVDVPGARQSVINIGYLGLGYTDPDYYPATVMNYKLGGSFNSVVNMILREEKGYTYGARSGFSGSFIPGTFTASSSVQSRVTLESVEIFRDSMTNYREGISAEDLDFTRSALVKSNARRFETLGALLGMLNNIGTFGLPVDYIKTHEEIAKTMTAERHQELAQKYIQPNRMIYLVVGDAATQLDQLSKLGFGKPILIENK